MDMGKPWVRSGALELFRLFRGIWKLGEVVLRVWKLRLCAMEKLRGRFGGYGNLKGLFKCLKTLVCGAVGNLESAFRGIWKLRDGRFRSVETWHSCTLETFGVHSRYSETSVLLCVRWNLERVRGAVGRVR